MSRPPRYSVDQLLDAALAVADRAGPAGITMSAVAREAGAPSGSLYHRFEGRDALVAALWLRTVERFQTTWLEAVQRHDDPDAACDVAFEALFAWVDAHPLEARLLLVHHRDDLRTEAWAGEVKAHADRLATEADRALERLARQLGSTQQQTTFAVAGIPLAALQPALRERRPVSPEVKEAARRAAREARRPSG